MNAHATFVTIPVEGGADIIVQPRRGHVISREVEVDPIQVVIRVRKDDGPRTGETVMVDGKAATVAERRRDSNGRLQIRDEDTNSWMVVRKDG